MPVAQVGALVIVLFAAWWLSRPGAAPSQSSGYATALEACTAALGNATSAADLGGWQVEVQADRPVASALLMVRGDTEDLCVTSRDGAGRFTATSSGWGRITPQASSVLTYDTGRVLPGQDAASTLQAVAGRAPTGSTAVVVSMSDGATARAEVTNGHYLALVNTVALPDRILALDSSGAEIARLANADGLTAQ